MWRLSKSANGGAEGKVVTTKLTPSAAAALSALPQTRQQRGQEEEEKEDTAQDKAKAGGEAAQSWRRLEEIDFRGKHRD